MQSHIDLDQYVEEKYQMTISQMFAISQEYFRERESLCCQDVASLQGYIISTGGGVVCSQKNIELLKKNGMIIYLDRPIQNILQDIDISNRPMLRQGSQKLYELYEQRHPLYMKACDYRIKNYQSINDTVDSIIDYINHNI